MSQREVTETLDNILKGVPQVWLVRKRQPSQGTLSLTQLVCPQLTGGEQAAKSQNIVELTGASQVQSPVRSQMNHQIYQSHKSLEKV